MRTVIQMHAHPRLLNIVRAAINHRAQAAHVPEPLRLRALAAGFQALRADRSTGCAIAMANAVMRPGGRDSTSPAPEAA